MGLGLLHGFVRISFWGGVFSCMPHTVVEDEGELSVCPLPFEQPGMSGPTKSLHSCQHSSPDHWSAQTTSVRYRLESLGRTKITVH
jgi:hypothetical protein